MDKNQSYLKNRFSKVISLMAIGLLLAMELTGFVSAGREESEEGLASEAAAVQETIAQWIFKDKGENGLFPATGGVNQTASSIRDVGTNTDAYTYESGENSVRNQGWHEGTGIKYWLATLSTKDFEAISLSSQQTSSSTGPKDFKVQYSTNQQEWTDVVGGKLVLAQNNFNCANNSCKLTNLALPAGINNQDVVYIRWVVDSVKSVSGGTVSSSGSSRIKDVVIKGTRISGEPGDTPTLEVSKTPASGAADVSLNAEITIKFNKAISLDSGFQVVITENSVPLNNISASLLGQDTVRVSHPNFTSGKTYQVTIPKELVKGAMDGRTPDNNITWSFKTKSLDTGNKTPTLLNMTFNGDPKTSIAFDWYTAETVRGTVVQVVEASNAGGNDFPEQLATSYEGSSTVIETLMTSGDRSSKKYKKFASHKVIASDLKPGTKYMYRAGNGDADGWSETGSFTTDKANNQDFHFLYVTDTQGSSKSNFDLWQDTFKRAIEKTVDPKFVLLTGDLTDDGDLEQLWQWFLGVPKKEFANVPFAPIIGNHEIEDYPNNNFYNHFNLPKDVGTGAHDGSVYAFEYGDALFMQINSQYEGEVKPYKADIQFTKQLEWMRNQVAKTDKKWKFVSMHKGAYSSGDNASAESDRVEFYRKYLIPVFDELGVDMVFEGHDHMYMRSFQMLNNVPIKNVITDEQGNVLNPKGTVYLMGNSAASKFYALNPDADTFFAAKNEQPNKKMFVDVSISNDVLKFTSYTAVKDKPLAVYDVYSIKRTDVKPGTVQNPSAVRQSGNRAVLSWKAPANSSEPVRGYRIYEKNDKVSTNWSIYVPAVSGQMSYSYTVNGIDSAKAYNFVIKAVGTRSNSLPAEAGMQ
ncbi:metallophosphoesterase [Paenibacillus sp. JNUCC31]|uniref:metallophosphoesterase n=1 Tax=Paenibacillus sp. JNUCC-31 TaxID=2777983 RepID=UPI00178319C5|nr:metallophosphoesterase [Paenibacillus sp. JNUCC-31]QOS79835.1 metallophosphoesterase [Paenibacillus sp. JNUCC-31]